MENSTFFKTFTTGRILNVAILGQLPSSSDVLPRYADVVPFPVISIYGSSPFKKAEKELVSAHAHNNPILSGNVQSPYRKQIESFPSILNYRFLIIFSVCAIK